MIKMIKDFIFEEEAVAAIEFAFVFPVAISMFLGVMDLGNGLLLSRKMVTTTQTIADYLAREEAISGAEIQDSMRAAEFILAPYSDDGLGYDIVSIRFDSDDNPEERWRETFNMNEDARFPNDTDGLGTEGEGVLVVVMTYTYRPSFYHFILGDVELRETSVLRGRRTPYIPWEGA